MAVKTTRKLADRIADAPAELQRRARRGFQIASALPDDVVKQVVDGFLLAVKSGVGAFEIEPVAEKANIGRSEASSIVAAISFVAGLVSEDAASLQEFADGGSEKLFEPADKSAALKIIQWVLDHQVALEDSYEKASLAAQTLPSLRMFDVTVDLRPKFENLEIKDAVSILLVHIDTDGDPEIWLQLTRGEIEIILEKLRTAAARMDVLDALAKSSFVKRSP